MKNAIISFFIGLALGFLPEILGHNTLSFMIYFFFLGVIGLASVACFTIILIRAFQRNFEQIKMPIMVLAFSLGFVIPVGVPYSYKKIKDNKLIRQANEYVVLIESFKDSTGYYPEDLIELNGSVLTFQLNYNPDSLKEEYELYYYNNFNILVEYSENNWYEYND